MTDGKAIVTGSALAMPATLELATPQALRAALALLGFEWTPKPFSEIPMSVAHGLYAWVISTRDESDLLAAPTVYIGMGASKDGGLYGRLSSEIRWAKDAKNESEWSFIHPRAMASLNGKPVGGPVQVARKRDLSWLNDLLERQAADTHRYEVVENAFNDLRKWLLADRPITLRKAERLCIRAAAYLGDCAPPLNSHFATAWNNYKAYEWGGWAAAQQLLANA